jgi:nucleotide-binding universal stress UspA family protein
MKLASIVVGIDGSENGQLALEAAADMAEMAGATVYVVCAYDPMPPDMYRDMLAQLPDEYRHTFDPEETHRRVVDSALAYLDGRDVAGQGHLLPQHPVAAILETADAEDADLIVVGSRGTGWATRAFRGSVSTRIATHAKRSVLIIHDED